jgi:hypothetical protein
MSSPSPSAPNGAGHSGEPADCGGDRAGEIVLAVYEELRAIASGFLQRERQGHTLQTTALVNEACGFQARSNRRQ